MQLLRYEPCGRPCAAAGCIQAIPASSTPVKAAVPLFIAILRLTQSNAAPTTSLEAGSFPQIALLTRHGRGRRRSLCCICSPQEGGMKQFGIGQPIRRVEDRRFLTGYGRYLDDIVRPREAHGAVLRSPHAHARIRALDI